MDICFDLFRPHQHGIASKQAQVPKKNIRCSKSAVLVAVVVNKNSILKLYKKPVYSVLMSYVVLPTFF